MRIISLGGDGEGMQDNRDKFIATDVATIEEFLDKYYRPDRYCARGEDYAASLLASHKAHFARWGHDLISRHDSVRGEAVWFYGGGGK